MNPGAYSVLILIKIKRHIYKYIFVLLKNDKSISKVSPSKIK